MNVGVEIARAHYDHGTRIAWANIWLHRSGSSRSYFVGDPHASRAGAEAANRAPGGYFIAYRVRVKMKVRP